MWPPVLGHHGPRACPHPVEAVREPPIISAKLRHFWRGAPLAPNLQNYRGAIIAIILNDYFSRGAGIAGILQTLAKGLAYPA